MYNVLNGRNQKKNDREGGNFLHDKFYFIKLRMNEKFLKFHMKTNLRI